MTHRPDMAKISRSLFPPSLILLQETIGMRNVLWSAPALLLLGIALVGCSQSNDSSSQDSSGPADTTVVPGGAHLVLTVEGMS